MTATLDLHTGDERIQFIIKHGDSAPSRLNTGADGVEKEKVFQRRYESARRTR